MLPEIKNKLRNNFITSSPHIAHHTTAEIFVQVFPNQILDRSLCSQMSKQQRPRNADNDIDFGTEECTYAFPADGVTCNANLFILINPQWVHNYMYMYTVHVHVNERCKERKKEASKVMHANNKAKQHNTPKAVTFPKKNKLPWVGLAINALNEWAAVHSRSVLN